MAAPSTSATPTPVATTATTGPDGAAVEHKLDGKPTLSARAAEAAPPNASELKVIATINERLGERMNGVAQSVIIRFVRGFSKSQQPLETTVKAMDAYLKYRIESKVDEVARTQYPRTEEFKTMWQSGLHGVSKSGHVLFVNRLGKIDPTKLFKSFTLDQVRNFHIQEMEHIVAAKEELSRQSGQLTYKHFAILDLEGVGTGHFAHNFREPIKQVINIDQNMYPETLYIMVITNYSFVFKAIWAVASLWIDPITKSRILWGKDELVKYIDKDQLPKFLGGTCKCAKCLVTPFIPGDGAATRAPSKSQSEAKSPSLPPPTPTNEEVPTSPATGSSTEPAPSEGGSTSSVPSKPRSRASSGAATSTPTLNGTEEASLTANSAN